MASFHQRHRQSQETDHHRRTQSQSLTDIHFSNSNNNNINPSPSGGGGGEGEGEGTSGAGGTTSPNSGRTSTVGGNRSTVGGRSTIIGRQSTTSASNIGKNSSCTGNNNNNNNTNKNSHGASSSHYHHQQQQQQQQLFDPSGAGISRRALLYDMERHKLESLPLTRLFRFLADSPNWFSDGAGGASGAGGSSTYTPTDAGHSSSGGGKANNNNNNNQQQHQQRSHHHLIKNLVVASPEGGRHVSKRQRDIDRARLASVLADRNDDLIIPDTIVWEASIPRGWFFTSFDGTDGRASVQRRSVDIGVIEKQWTEGLPPHAVAAAYYTIAERDPAASIADKDTPLLQFQFLRACELSKFLHVQATQTSGSDCAAILQQFTYPLHAHNVVIQAVWSPRVLNITIRQNVNGLHDDRLDANTRACTFEGYPHLSLELRPTTRLYGQVESAIHSLTKHFAAVDAKSRIVRIVAYFKVDKESRLNLLYVPSVRVMRAALIERPVGLRSSPFFSAFRVALDVAVEYETLSTVPNAFMPTSSSTTTTNTSTTSAIHNTSDTISSSSGGHNVSSGRRGGGGGENKNQHHHSSSGALMATAIAGGAGSGGSAGATLLTGGGGSRIRKSASKKGTNSSENKNNSNGKGNNNSKAPTFEGSRLLADALQLSLQEMNLLVESKSNNATMTTTTTIGTRPSNSNINNNNNGKHQNRLSFSSSSLSSSPLHDKDRSSHRQRNDITDGSGEGVDARDGGVGVGAGAVVGQGESEGDPRDSIQYKLSHSPVIGQQRADLVEIVMDIVRNSHNPKEVKSAVTRAFRHAATPAARDALKWAAVEAGLICHDDDSYSHPFFEVGEELRELMKYVCEDYREDETIGEEKEAHAGGGDVISAQGNNKNNHSDNENDVGTNFDDKNNYHHFAHSQFLGSSHQNVHHHHHRRLPSGEMSPLSSSPSLDQPKQQYSINLNRFDSNLDQSFHSGASSAWTAIGGHSSSTAPPPPLSNLQSNKSQQQLQEQQQQHPNLFLPAALQQQQQQQSNNFSFGGTPATNNIKSPTAASCSVSPTQRNLQHHNNHHHHNQQQQQQGLTQSWKRFAEIVKSGVGDFLYELLDSRHLSEVATSASSTSVFGGTNNLPFDYECSLGSISCDAARVCEIVLETCRSIVTHHNQHYDHTHNHNQQQQQQQYHNLSLMMQRSLPIAVGPLWPDVSVRDAVAIAASAVFGLMYSPAPSQTCGSSDDNTNFYLKLKENERREKEQEKEKRKQQWIRQQMEEEEEAARNINNNHNNSGSNAAASTVTQSASLLLTSPSRGGINNNAPSFSSLQQLEDVSVFYEGLHTAAPVFFLQVHSLIRPQGTDLQNHSTTTSQTTTTTTTTTTCFALHVSVKNATQLGLQCQVRKVLGDVMAALANTPLNLLLPEIAEERRRKQLQRVAAATTSTTAVPSPTAAAAALKQSIRNNNSNGSGSITRRSASNSVISNKNNSNNNSNSNNTTNNVNNNNIIISSSNQNINNNNNNGNSTNSPFSASQRQRQRSQTTVAPNNNNSMTLAGGGTLAGSGEVKSPLLPTAQSQRNAQNTTTSGITMPPGSFATPKKIEFGSSSDSDDDEL